MRNPPAPAGDTGGPLTVGIAGAGPVPNHRSAVRLPLSLRTLSLRTLSLRTLWSGYLRGRLRSRTGDVAVRLPTPEDAVHRDPLTGLVNRPAWDIALPTGLDRARREAKNTTVILVELDFFKLFHDSHGHRAGDRLLKEASAAWAAQLRPIDVFARYGDEAFIALLPACDARAAALVVQRLRSVTPRGQTFCAGIATWNAQESSEQIVARADRALHAAKDGGADRYVVAVIEPGEGTTRRPSPTP